MLQFPLMLHHEFQSILDQLERSSDHFFITGKAGTGKSTLLQIFRRTTRKRVAILAPTGIAALNVKGQTIHSFFGFPPKMLDPSDIKRSANYRLYQNIDAIVIDEISMVRADMLDNINLFLQKNRNNSLPFGGVQMIYFGDLFQLPPVVSTDFERQYFQKNYDSPYFFSAYCMKAGNPPIMLELTKVYRQSERKFVDLLDQIRISEIDEYTLETLNTRYVPVPSNTDFYITLCSRNAIADAINMKELQKLTDDKKRYPATITGTFAPQLFPTEQILQVCRGAQVMFVKNDPLKQYVNGTIGKIEALSEDTLEVIIIDSEGYEKKIEVTPQDWEIIKYTRDTENPEKIATEIIGTFRQFPIKLAWAITIHKSQGKTFDRVIIDLGGGAFEFGQTYVALSRCRTLEGIILKKPIRSQDIFVDEKVMAFYDFMRRYS